MSQYPIGVGDVCLDLAQGRPVHVIEASGQTVAEWSDANDYDLTDNYANSRLGVRQGERVLEVVYCSNAKSEPSKTYAMPASRLLRVETEAGDGGRPVYHRAIRETLEGVFLALADAGMDHRIDGLADNLRPAFGDDLVDEARELADVEQTVGAADD